MVALEGADRGQGGFELAQALPDAEAPPVAFLDSSGVDGSGKPLGGEQRSGRPGRRLVRQAVGQEELVHAEVEAVRLRLELLQALQTVLQEASLLGPLGGQGGVFLI